MWNKKSQGKIGLLISHLRIAEANKDGVLLAAQNKAIEDFEDGLECYDALAAGCSCIVTEDLNDFYISEIEVLKA